MPTTMLNPGDDIQTAIDNATPGDEIQLAAGTYTLAAQLTVDQEVSIVGAGDGQTTIETHGGSWGILVTADNTTISDLTVDASSTTIYGVKVQPDDTSDATDSLTNFTLENVTVSGAGRSEIDLNGVDNAQLTNVTADGQDTAGVGIALSDSTGITLTDITTSGNNWGSIGLFSAGRVWEPGTNDITFAGIYDASEPTKIYADEEGSTTVENIDFSGIYTTVYKVENSAFRDGVDGRSDDFTFFFGSESDAVAYATGLQDGNDNDVSAASVITTDDTPADVDAETGTTFIVADGMSIQAAIEAADDDDTILVRPGTYEGFTVDKDLTIDGPNATLAGFDSARDPEATVEGNIVIEANGATLRGFEVANFAPTTNIPARPSASPARPIS